MIDILNKSHTDARFIDDDYLRSQFRILKVQYIDYLFLKKNSFHSSSAILLLRRSAKLRIRAAQERSKFAFGFPEVASECPEVASELVGDIFEFFELRKKR